MNANELADMIDSDNWVGMDDQEHIEWEMKAATMLRQQQAEIEALKVELSFFQKEKSAKELKLATRYFDKAQEK